MADSKFDIENLMELLFSKKFSEVKHIIDQSFESDIDLKYETMICGILVSLYAIADLESFDISKDDVMKKLESYRGIKFNNYLISKAKENLNFCIETFGDKNEEKNK